MSTARKTDAELSRIYRDAFESHPSRETDPGEALADAGAELREHLAPAQTGYADAETLTWKSDEIPAVKLGVDVVSTIFDSGEGRVFAHDGDLSAPWKVRWDRTGKIGECEADHLRVVGRGVS